MLKAEASRENHRERKRSALPRVSEQKLRPSVGRLRRKATRVLHRSVQEQWFSLNRSAGVPAGSFAFRCHPDRAKRREISLRFAVAFCFAVAFAVAVSGHPERSEGSLFAVTPASCQITCHSHTSDPPIATDPFPLYNNRSEIFAEEGMRLKLVQRLAMLAVA